jgi:hypothetical protein
MRHEIITKLKKNLTTVLSINVLKNISERVPIYSMPFNPKEFLII